MKIKFRNFTPYKDSSKVSEFLCKTYPPSDRNPNWHRARWEYMVYAIHDGIEENLSPIGLWETDQKIVGMVNFESQLGEAYFHTDPAFAYLKKEMLHFAETQLGNTENGTTQLTLFVNEFDQELERLAETAGYKKMDEHPQVTARLNLIENSCYYELPEGFQITDRRKNNDLWKINRVLWRGFNHEGSPPEKYIAGRANVEKAPLFRKNLVTMVEDPDGNFVSYCGLWYEEATKVAYVEPVATDPDYRRMGLGKAAVLESLKRAKKLGATRAIVISGQQFYQALGFQKLFSYYPWRRSW